MIENLVAGALLFLTLPSLMELSLLTIGAIFACLKRKKTSERSPHISSKMAVIIPAYNEEVGIKRTINSLKCCQGLFEIIVIADNCSDQTAAIAKACHVRVLERRDLNNRGKHYALRFAFNILLEENYDYFLVIDADTVVSSNLIEEVQRKFDKGADAIQVFYGILNGDVSMRLRLMKIAFLAFNHLRYLGRDFWGFSTGVCGNGIAFSRKTLQTVPFNLNSIVEDLVYHLCLVEAGKRVDYTDCAKVWAEMPLNQKAMADQRARWEGGRLRTAYRELPKLVKMLMQGNWRLAEPCLDLMTWPLSYLVLMLLIAVMFPLSYARIYGMVGLTIVFFHLCMAMIIGRCNWKDYLALVIAPLYLLWKVLLIGKLSKNTTKGAPWKRTKRKGEH